MIDTKKIYCIDVGGTEIKAAIADESGNILGDIKTFDAKSDLGKAEILENFQAVFTMLIESHLHDFSHSTDDFDIPAGIGIAFPGNFDYENGICLMKNVGKYDSIYNVNLSTEFIKIFSDISSTNHKLNGLEKCPIKFINDVSAFALGESLLLPETRSERVFCLCIGTGCGSAFQINGRPVLDEAEGIPPHGWVFPLPYNDSILDDYLSKRGLLRITKMAFGREVEGLELATLFKNGDTKAKDCFMQFGEQFPEAISNIVDEFLPDRLIFGGQIAKSFDLFGGSLKKFCDSKGLILTVSPETSKSTIKGISTLF